MVYVMILGKLSLFFLPSFNPLTVLSVDSRVSYMALDQIIQSIRRNIQLVQLQMVMEVQIMVL